MKAIVINATVNEGNSKKQDPNGRDYTIATCTILVPFEPRTWNNANGSGSSRGYGLVTTEIDMHPEALLQIKQFEKELPLELELETETEYRRNGAVSVVHGFKRTQPVLKTA